MLLLSSLTGETSQLRPLRLQQDLLLEYIQLLILCTFLLVSDLLLYLTFEYA